MWICYYFHNELITISFMSALRAVSNFFIIQSLGNTLVHRPEIYNDTDNAATFHIIWKHLDTVTNHESMRTTTNTTEKHTQQESL